MPRSLLKNWLGLSRTRLFTAVIVPAVIGGAVAGRQGLFSIDLFLLIIIGLVLVESSSLFLGDWVTREGKSFFSRTAPPPMIEGSPMIAERILPSRYTIHASVLCLLSAALVLVYFALMRGWLIILLGLFAVLVGFFYAFSPIKYGFFSTALLPPLLTLSVDFALADRFTLVALLAGLPLLFSSAGVIYTYRVLYDRALDTDSFSSRSRVVVLLYCLAFLSVILLNVFEFLPPTTSLVVLALPALFYLNARLRKEQLDYVPATSWGVLLHATMGLLVALGFILG